MPEPRQKHPDLSGYPESERERFYEHLEAHGDDYGTQSLGSILTDWYYL